MVLRDSNRWRTMEPDNLKRAELSGHLASARSPGMLSVSPGANLNPIDFTDGQLAWTQVTTGPLASAAPWGSHGGEGAVSGVYLILISINDTIN